MKSSGAVDTSDTGLPPISEEGQHFPGNGEMGGGGGILDPSPCLRDDIDCAYCCGLVLAIYCAKKCKNWPVGTQWACELGCHLQKDTFGYAGCVDDCLSYQ
jgi:hypothetical protein